MQQLKILQISDGKHSFVAFKVFLCGLFYIYELQDVSFTFSNWLPKKSCFSASCCFPSNILNTNKEYKYITYCKCYCLFYIQVCSTCSVVTIICISMSKKKYCERMEQHKSAHPKLENKKPHRKCLTSYSSILQEKEFLRIADLDSWRIQDLQFL